MIEYCVNCGKKLSLNDPNWYYWRDKYPRHNVCPKIEYCSKEEIAKKFDKVKVIPGGTMIG